MLYLSISSDIGKYIKEAIINAWRFLNGQLDSIAYKLLSSLYDFFKELSEVYLYNEKIMQTIGRRIGLVLGIFVLFRLAVALVSYIINPDKLTDSSKGTKKIITNIALSLILLGTVNIIFKEAYILQKKIVSSQVIEKMFFGEKAQTEDVDISYYLYSAFVQVNLPECEKDDIYNSEEISEQCTQKLNSEDAARRLVVDQIMAKKNIRPILSSYNNINETVDGDYLFDYTPVISLICAIVAILMLLSSCMDVATRIIKLLFLQIIAPIPIVSNMAPGKGEESFKKWYKECINTYLSLFIRIAVISFAIFMISLIKTEFAEIFKGRNILIQVLLIIGCLIFAKQAPKLIENIFGIKMDGMLLHPLKKFQEQALFGKQITGVAAGTVAGTVAGIGALGSNVLAPGKGGRVLGAGAGFASAFSRSVAGGLKGEKFKNNISKSYNISMQNKQSRADRLDDDVKWLEMKKSHIQQAMGMHSKDDAVKSEKKHITKLQEAYKIIQNQSSAMDTTNFNVSAHNSAYTGTNAEIRQFRTMNFNGIKELIKFKEQADSTKLQQRAGESDASFIQRQKEHQDYLKYIEGTIDNRNNALAAGTASTGDLATDHAIQDAFRTMKEEANAFNSSIDSIDPKVGHITITDAKTINGTSKGADARLSVSKVSQHQEKVQQYGAKKNQK